MDEEQADEQVEEHCRQKVIIGTNLSMFARRLNSMLANSLWRIVPGTIGCGHTRRKVAASPVNLESEEIDQHFWAIVEHV